MKNKYKVIKKRNFVLKTKKQDLSAININENPVNISPFLFRLVTISLFLIIISSLVSASSYFCGDFKCQFNESLYCNSDCGNKLITKLDSSYYNFVLNQDAKVTLELRNLLDNDLILNLQSNYKNIEIKPDFTLKAKEEIFIPLDIDTNTSLGFYSSDLIVKARLKYPLDYIDNLLKDAQLNNNTINITNETNDIIRSYIYKKTLPFNIKYYSINDTELIYYKLKLNNDIVNSKDDAFLTLDTNDKSNQTLAFFIKNSTNEYKLDFDIKDNLYILKLSKLNLSDGEYRIILRYFYNNYQLETIQSIQVKLSLINKNLVYLLVRIFIVLFIIFVIFYTIYRVKKYQFSKQTFIHPDFNKIPDNKEENFMMGKIPETIKKAYFDPDKLTTHTLVAGSTGSGKSVTASIFVEECLLHKIPVVIFDPTAQWTGFVKSCRDEVVLKTYKKFNLTENDARSFKGLIYNVKDENIKIDFNKYINPGEVTVFNLAKLNTEQYNKATESIIQQLFEHGFSETPHLRVLIVFDEVHRLLDQYGGQGGYHALEKAAREFRKWGLGLLMISQVSSDFKEAIGGNVLTEIQLNTKSIEDIKKMESKYGKEYSKSIIRLKIGMGIIQNPHFNGGNPWFIHFRPPLHSPHKISDEELQMYDDYARKIDAIEERLNEIKKKKDISDIELEINLAKKKLKEGKFKMVKIYLDTIESSINSL